MFDIVQHIAVFPQADGRHYPEFHGKQQQQEQPAHVGRNGDERDRKKGGNAVQPGIWVCGRVDAQRKTYKDSQPQTAPGQDKGMREGAAYQHIDGPACENVRAKAAMQDIPNEIADLYRDRFIQIHRRAGLGDQVGVGSRSKQGLGRVAGNDVHQ
jgi:hypothetical protein